MAEKEEIAQRNRALRLVYLEKKFGSIFLSFSLASSSKKNLFSKIKRHL